MTYICKHTTAYMDDVRFIGGDVSASPNGYAWPVSDLRAGQHSGKSARPSEARSGLGVLGRPSRVGGKEAAHERNGAAGLPAGRDRGPDALGRLVTAVATSPAADLRVLLALVPGLPDLQSTDAGRRRCAPSWRCQVSS